MHIFIEYKNTNFQLCISKCDFLTAKKRFIHHMQFTNSHVQCGIFDGLTSKEKNEGVHGPSCSLSGEGPASTTFFGCPRRHKCRGTIGRGQKNRYAPFTARIILCMCSCLKRWFIVRICLTPAIRRSTSTFCILIPKPTFASAFKSQCAFVCR